MARNKHSKSEVEQALRHAESCGWAVNVGGSHAWGKLLCPFNDKDCRGGDFCLASISSTPKNAGNHARQLRRVVDNCTRLKQCQEEDSNE